MPDPTRPFLVLYIVWHPKFAKGSEMAEYLLEHFRRKLYENVAGGTGLSVILRSAPAPGSSVPLPIDLGQAETTAIVLLAESALAEDENWISYVRELEEQTENAGLKSLLFPVAVEPAALEILFEEQALRLDQWYGTEEELRLKLISKLTYAFCRMLRHYSQTLLPM